MRMEELWNRIVAALTHSGNQDLAMLLQTVASADRLLYDNEWLQLRETPDRYVYAHESKSDGRGVAVLAYRQVGRDIQVAGRYERCPCHHDGFALCALTGQMEKDEDDPAETAARELQEEAGIRAEASELARLGTVRPGKQTDTTLHLYGIDVGERDIGKATGDGTSGEVGAYCAWVSIADACSCKDPVMAALVVRLFGSRFGLR